MKSVYSLFIKSHSASGGNPETDLLKELAGIQTSWQVGVLNNAESEYIPFALETFQTGSNQLGGSINEGLPPNHPFS